MSADLAATLEALRPHRRVAIMDLVADAGLDVSNWGFRKDGSKLDEPRNNQGHSREWAFGGKGQPTVLCIWHANIQATDGAVMHQGNMRKRAEELNRVAIDPNDKKRKSARRTWRHARNFDALLQGAFQEGGAVRVIVVAPATGGGASIDEDVNGAKLRSLDPESWYVHSYGDDGEYRMVRGVPPCDAVDEATEVEALEQFVDQFSVPEPTAQRELAGSAYLRSRAVREAVLRRASGVCECCAAPGFRTNAGAIYLETHHVVPLSEGGPDVEWNVVALCPNDHRRAHHGEDREVVRARLTAVLAGRSPGAAVTLQGVLGAVKA